MTRSPRTKAMNEWICVSTPVFYFTFSALINSTNYFSILSVTCRKSSNKWSSVTSSANPPTHSVLSSAIFRFIVGKWTVWEISRVQTEVSLSKSILVPSGGRGFGVELSAGVGRGGGGGEGGGRFIAVVCFCLYMCVFCFFVLFASLFWSRVRGGSLFGLICLFVSNVNDAKGLLMFLPNIMIKLKEEGSCFECLRELQGV